MHLNDFLDPERAVKAMFKLFAAGLVLIIVGSELIRRLAYVTLPPRAGLWVLLGLAPLSIAAYFIREHRMRERLRPRNIRGAERTPILPHIEEDEE